MPKEVIHTQKAPQAIGPYSQAIKIDNIVFLSGQIPLSPETGELVSDDFKAQAQQVFRNVEAVCHAAGGTLADIVKLTIYLTDLNQFAVVNDIMTQFFQQPYPSRAAIEVSALPKGSLIEVADVTMMLDSI